MDVNAYPTADELDVHRDAERLLERGALLPSLGTVLRVVRVREGYLLLVRDGEQSDLEMERVQGRELGGNGFLGGS